MTDINGITEETLDAVRKAQTAGVVGTTGLYGYDLSGVVSLVPVVTPTFERIKREQGDGSQAAHWRAMLNINNTQPNPFTGIDGGGSFVNFSELDVLAQYQPLRLSGKVTQDAIALAKNYADAKAIAVTGTLMQWRIAANKAIIGGQNFPLPAIGATTLTASATGGTIGASIVVHIRAAARSAYNYYYGGSGAASVDNSVTVSAGTTNSVAASVPAVRGAVAYDWFAANGGGTAYYVGTTTTNKFTLTSMPAANAPVPVAGFPSLSNIQPTAVPAVDTSYSTNAYNGILATLSGDYGTNGLVQAGSGTTSGATFMSLDGATLTGSAQGITELDNLNELVFEATNLSPSVYLMNSQQAKDIKGKVFGGGNAVTYLEPQGNGRAGATAGGSVARYLNGSAGGEEIMIVVDPHIPPGTILALTERVPYPNSGIANTFSVRTLRDVAEFDYGVSLSPGANGGPREEWDVSSLETLTNKAPVTCAVINNIAAG
jgi:hypothetical protein